MKGTLHINIGFIGGCINNQNGISRDSLFYSVMRKCLRQSGKDAGYQVSLGSYLSFDQLVVRSKDFITKKKPNILFLFIRPFPFMPLQKPFVKYEKSDGSQIRTLHPALFNRKLVWKEALTKNQSTNDFVFVPRKKIGLRDLNLIIGIALGLHHWARRYVVEQLGLVSQLCEQNNVQLKIVSPPQNPESAIGNLTCKWLANFISEYCRRKHIEFININTFAIDKFETDKIHFNVYGHKVLGEVLYSALSVNSSCSQ